MDGTSPRLASSMPNNILPLCHPNQSRPLPPSHANMNGVPPTSAQNINGQVSGRVGGIPQAQMQPLMQGQQRLPSQMNAESMRIFMEANRVQQQQQNYLAQQRQQQQPHSSGQSGSPSSNGNLSIPSQGNNAMLASLHGTNGISSSQIINGTSGLSRSSVSPRLGNSMQAQPLSSGMVPAVNQMSAQIKARHPLASPEQVSKMTTESLNQQYRMMQSQNQLAMNTAAGTGIANVSSQQAQQQGVNMMNGVNGAGGSPMLNSHMYAQMMRNQQSSQQNRSVAGSQAAMNATAGGRPPSRNMQVGSNQSPRPQQAQMAGTQAM